MARAKNRSKPTAAEPVAAQRHVDASAPTSARDVIVEGWLGAEIRRIISLAAQSSDWMVRARAIAVSDAKVVQSLRAAVDAGCDIRGSTVVPRDDAAAAGVVTFLVGTPRAGSWLMSRTFAAAVDLSSGAVTHIVDPVPAWPPGGVDVEAVPFAVAAPTDIETAITPQSARAPVAARESEFARARGIDLAATTGGIPTTFPTTVFGGPAGGPIGTKPDVQDDL